MLLSMTGFGEAHHETETVSVSVEVRSVNNRYLKVSSRFPEVYASFENEIERLVRGQVNRGTVNLTLRASLVHSGFDTRVNPDAIAGYWEQLQQLSKRGIPLPADCTGLLELPGVVIESDQTTQSLREHWPVVIAVIESALESLNRFRQAEGSAMTVDLREQCEVLRKELNEVAGRAPDVVVQYRQRTLERVRELVADASVRIEENDLIREVSVFADRCDINEEIQRLNGHIDQFHAFLEQDRSQGRKLEFLIQEMFRETNTIGSKANDIEIAHSVVEMKSAIEKMREMVQNIE